jgi:hypothetical protein
MSLIRINHRPGSRQLRVFAGAWLIFFGLLAIFLRAKGHQYTAVAVGGIAIGIPSIGLAVPEVLRLAYLGLSYATFPIGWVISHAILAALYYLVFTPVGLLLRLFDYDPLERRIDRAVSTYWKPRDERSSSVDRYFRQH